MPEQCVVAQYQKVILTCCPLVFGIVFHYYILGLFFYE